ncbi:hypothetical protein CDAR_486091 [Caerostris darwini]|uniref:Uncharacterized protein n=1 Tax=Caerostris darwini TaxID=1538125 RepID=A0AAV4M9L3_9ARAC|nr:hypothetical protein CDAR_486091 [Caerostris darwini]
MNASSSWLQKKRHLYHSTPFNKVEKKKKKKIWQGEVGGLGFERSLPMVEPCRNHVKSRFGPPRLSRPNWRVLLDWKALNLPEIYDLFSVGPDPLEE